MDAQVTKHAISICHSRPLKDTQPHVSVINIPPFSVGLSGRLEVSIE
jgi:hypothetical protein